MTAISCACRYLLNSFCGGVFFFVLCAVALFSLFLFVIVVAVMMCSNIYAIESMAVQEVSQFFVGVS